MRMCLLSVTVFLHCLVCGQASSAMSKMWQEWKIKHGKSYDNQTEILYRRAVWERSLRSVIQHNQEASAGKHSYAMGLNHLSDLTTEEINEWMNGLRPEERQSVRNASYEEMRSWSSPGSVDWREKGLVSPVQNQGLCGSCWAFSSLGALEGQMVRRTGVLVPLSKQNLLDCSGSEGNRGCRGGYITKAFSYVIHNGGIDSESFYPYEYKTGLCRYSVKGKAGSCASFRMLPYGDENTLQAAVASVGPVAVAIDARLPSFHLYQGGVYNDPNCNPKLINHAVLVVGYGTSKGQDFWLVKNSWGTTWGEQGFIRIARNENNLCGIASFAVYPTM